MPNQTAIPKGRSPPLIRCAINRHLAMYSLTSTAWAFDRTSFAAMLRSRKLTMPVQIRYIAFIQAAPDMTS